MSDYKMVVVGKRVAKVTGILYYILSNLKSSIIMEGERFHIFELEQTENIRVIAQNTTEQCSPEKLVIIMDIINR